MPEERSSGSRVSESVVTFVVTDPETVARRLRSAKVEVKVEQHYMRISPSIYNDQADVDALLNALS